MLGIPWVRWALLTCHGFSDTLTGPNSSPVVGYLLPLGNVTYVQYWKVWVVEVLFVAVTVYPSVPPRGTEVESGTRVIVTLGSGACGVALAVAPVDVFPALSIAHTR